MQTGERKGLSRSSFFAKRSSTVETEDTLLLDDDTSLESKSLGNLHFMTERVKNKLGKFCKDVSHEEDNLIILTP